MEAVYCWPDSLISTQATGRASVSEAVRTDADAGKTIHAERRVTTDTTVNGGRFTTEGASTGDTTCAEYGAIPTLFREDGEQRYPDHP